MVSFAAGENIAIKVPAHVYERAVTFWRDTVRLPVINSTEQATVFQYGSLRLWLDRVPQQSQVDVWFELRADNLDAATEHLSATGTPIRDELEPLGDLRAHWVSDPAGVVVLIHEEERGP